MYIQTLTINSHFDEMLDCGTFGMKPSAPSDGWGSLTTILCCDSSSDIVGPAIIKFKAKS
jgi:hypothetical protein